MKVVAISDSKGGIYNPDGLSIPQIEEIKQLGKSVQEYSNGQQITNEQLLALDVSILVPAALEQVIHANNASSIQAKVILELANGPVTPEADEILEQKSVVVIPDVLANA